MATRYGQQTPFTRGTDLSLAGAKRETKRQRAAAKKAGKRFTGGGGMVPRFVSERDRLLSLISGNYSTAATGTSPAGVPAEYAPYMEAMDETQRRAAEDRTKAISGVEGAEGRAIGAFGGVEELLRQAMAQPETMTPDVQAQMFEEGRTGIEAGTQGVQRQLQESFGRRGIQGVGSMSALAGIGQAGVGQAASLKRNIMIDAARTNRQNVLDLVGTGSNVARAKAGIYTGTGRTLADIYANTITAVPKVATTNTNLLPPAHKKGKGFDPKILSLMMNRVKGFDPKILSLMMNRR